MKYKNNNIGTEYKRTKQSSYKKPDKRTIQNTNPQNKYTDTQKIEAQK